MWENRFKIIFMTNLNNLSDMKSNYKFNQYDSKKDGIF